MEFRAELRYLRVSPQKARLVLDLIKGRKVEDARNTLAFTKKRVAAHVGKLLQSALDNANFLASEKNIDVEIDNLYVKRAVANEGPRMKRIRPGAAGTRLPLPAAHCAHRISAGRARQEWRGDYQRTQRGSGGGSGEGQAARSGSESDCGQEESESGGEVTAPCGRERSGSPQRSS